MPRNTEAVASPNPKPLLVYLDPDVHRKLKVRSAKDSESMRSITSRLLTLYVAGELPAAEPDHQQAAS